MRISAEKDFVPFNPRDENVIGHGEAFEAFLGDAPYVGGDVRLVVFGSCNLLLRQIVEHEFQRYAQIFGKLPTEKGHIAGGLPCAVGVFFDSFGHPIAHLAVSGLNRHAQRSSLLDRRNGMVGDLRVVFLSMGAAD